MARKRDYEQQAAQMEAQIAELTKKNGELTAALDEYRKKESAIAGALTSAQAASDRIVQEAEAKRAEIISDANADKRDAEREAKELIEDAKRRAGMIESDAKANARQTTAGAEALIAQYKANAGKLNAELKRMAMEAANHAEGFRAYAESVYIPENPAATDAKTNVAGEDEEKTPAEVMRSIYKLENREPPRENEDAAENSADAFAAMNAAAPSKDVPAEEAPAEAAAVEMPDAVETGEDNGEEKVWTVEEIVEKTSAGNDTSIDDELNAIIDDVLKGT